MRLRDQYPKLANFFSSWFPDADLDGLEDQDVVAEFLRTPNVDEHNAVRAELERLLNQSETLPCEDIGKEANRFFESEDDCRSWLSLLNNEFNTLM